MTDVSYSEEDGQVAAKVSRDILFNKKYSTDIERIYAAHMMWREDGSITRTQFAMIVDEILCY